MTESLEINVLNVYFSQRQFNKFECIWEKFIFFGVCLVFYKDNGRFLLQSSGKGKHKI